MPSAVTLPIQIADDLSEKIVVGSIAAGERLKILELCEIYGVSQIIIRSALVELSKRYLVRISQRRNYVVRTFSEAEVGHLWQVYTRLWGYSVRLLCENTQRDDALMSHIAEIEEELRRRMEDPHDDLKQAGWEAHGAINEFGSDEILKAMQASIKMPIRRIRYAAAKRCDEKQSEAMRRNSNVYMLELLCCVRKNDPDGAEQAWIHAVDEEYAMMKPLLAEGM